MHSSPSLQHKQKLLLSDFIEYPLKEQQHGFRTEHSTKTALEIVTNNIQKGTNQKKPWNRNLLVAVDNAAAFYTFDHKLLIRDVLEVLLPNSTKTWVASYLQDRFSNIEYNNKKSKRKSQTGCPTKRCTIANALQHLHETNKTLKRINIRSSADDRTINTSHAQVDKLRDMVTPYLNIRLTSGQLISNNQQAVDFIRN